METIRKEYSKNMTAGRRLLQYASNYKGALVLSLFFVLAANLLKAAGPAVLERAIDHLTSATARSTLIWYSLLFAGIALLQSALMFGQERLLMRSACWVERDLRSALFDHLQQLPLEFFQKHSTGELMTKINSDLTAAITGSVQALMFSLDSIFALIIILPLMTRISGALTAMAFAPLFLVVTTTVLIRGRMRMRFEQTQVHSGKVYSQAHAALFSVRTIRAFTQEQPEIEAFDRTSREYIRHYLERIRLSGLLHPLLQFFIGLSSVVVLWHGGDLTVAGKLSIGQLLQFIFYLGYVAWPMHVLGWQVTTFQRGMVSMGRVHGLLSIEPSIRNFPTTLHVRKPLGDLEFKEVSFRYRGAHRLALDHISFYVQPGQIVGLVGAVGSGKSTLMHLVPRLLTPVSGTILIGGRPLNHLPLDLLRSSIAYVPQDTFLFNDTIAANVAFGRSEARPSEVSRAAEAAGLAVDIAAFPEGYETIVGERGVTLSGGQRQRISIARAILRNSEILLLDDALSSVDLCTEQHILLRLREIMKGKTCLISSHRVSTIQSADLILVLHDGRIVEHGTHDDLLACEGFYKEIDKKQRLEEKLAAS
jgi:ATP-binding cassette subfamily B multidrug efflux pump